MPKYALINFIFNIKRQSDKTSLDWKPKCDYYGKLPTVTAFSVLNFSIKNMNLKKNYVIVLLVSQHHRIFIVYCDSLLVDRETEIKNLKTNCL